MGITSFIVQCENCKRTFPFDTMVQGDIDRHVCDPAAIREVKRTDADASKRAEVMSAARSVNGAWAESDQIPMRLGSKLLLLRGRLLEYDRA